MAQKENVKSFKDKYKVYFAAGITAWIIFMFIHPIAIAGDAMLPTLEAGQIIIVAKETFNREAPQIFSVVNFERDFSDQGEKNSNKTRRVVGIPGDTIEIKNGFVYRNGEALEEPYAIGVIEERIPAITLEDEEIYVLGDNREESLDSRHVGPLKMKALRGTCSWVIWPISEWSKVK
jgi:signal peptidase I